MSSVVFAGSAQLIATQLVREGAPALVLVLTIFVVNLRHALYSASVAPYVKHLGRRWKVALAYLRSRPSRLVSAVSLLAMGGIGYVLRKFGYDLAPVALGLVLAPMLELSLRQSLAMSAGDYSIFLQRPIATVMLALGAILLLFALKPLVFKGKDWRSEVGLEKQ